MRNVNLLVEPPAVRRGQSVALRCEYQLDGAPLYSIKFYRGQLEFYRFTPGEYPHTKVFQYPGIKVDVSRVCNSPDSPLFPSSHYPNPVNVSELCHTCRRAARTQPWCLYVMSASACPEISAAKSPPMPPSTPQPPPMRRCRS